MKLGDTLTKAEAQKEKPKGTDRFLKSKAGVLLKVYENKKEDMFLLLDEGVTPVILEEGDMLYNDNGTIRERIGEATPMSTEEIEANREDPLPHDFDTALDEGMSEEPKKPEKKKTMRKRRGKELSEPTAPTDLQVLPPQTSDIVTKDKGELEVISNGVRVAKAIKNVIIGCKLSSLIKGRDYVHVEGWQCLGAMLKISAIVEDVRVIEDPTGSVIGYEADAVLYDASGRVIAKGTMECRKTEKMKKREDGKIIERWIKHDEVDHMGMKSMAQTRAIGKAYRSKLGYIMKMAGYQATPAEEMVR